LPLPNGPTRPLGIGTHVRLPPRLRSPLTRLAARACTACIHGRAESWRLRGDHDVW
jgi:hypothetical protein